MELFVRKHQKNVFSLCWNHAGLFLSSSKRAARYWSRPEGNAYSFYFYFMDREFGLINVKLQTWFPMQIQIYVDGHDWLERKLMANGISVGSSFKASCQKAKGY